MKAIDLKKNSIALLGLGSENYALLEWLNRQDIHPSISIFEMKDERELLKIYPNLKRWKVSIVNHRPLESHLKNYDLIVPSPGVFLAPALRLRLARLGKRIIAPMQLFLDFCPSRRIIGVTGTKGKGTTSSLIQAILKKAGKRVWLGGNIGIAPFTFLSRIKASDWVVLELSSFQLKDMASSPSIAVLTNFSPEHLSPADPSNPNYHVSLPDYWQAKWNIARFQKKGDYLIANYRLKARLEKNKPAAKVIYFSQSSLPSVLPGEHNKENIAAAIEAARLVGIRPEVIDRAVKTFKGLPYRLQKIADKKGVAYYNDSFATTPEAAITALKALSQPIILLAGGADKGADFKLLAKEIKRRVKFLILFSGKATPRLKQELKKAGFPAEAMVEATSMKEAIRLARAQSNVGDTILLSPACASFGIFKDYKDRGEQFTKALLR